MLFIIIIIIIIIVIVIIIIIIIIMMQVLGDPTVEVFASRDVDSFLLPRCEMVNLRIAQLRIAYIRWWAILWQTKSRLPQS